MSIHPPQLNPSVFSMGLVKGSGVVENFFIFNPEFGEKEGEEGKKLLFYHPADHSLDHKVQNIGFCEAVVRFTESFSATPGNSNNLNDEAEQQEDPPFHEISTEKQVHIYSRIEGEFIMGVSVGRRENNYVLYAPTLHKVILNAYRMFVLFFGPFQRFLSEDGGGVNGLKHRLEYFFTRYLSSLKLNTLPLVDLFSGITFLGLDAENFLRVETFIEQIVEVLPQIKHTLFLYQDKLLWYTIPKRDLYVVYRYLTQNLLPMSLRAELQPEMQKKQSTAQHFGKFVTGPADLDQKTVPDKEDSSSGVKPPIVFLHSKINALDTSSTSVGGTSADSYSDVSHTTNDSTTTTETDSSALHEHHLVVYRALNATLAMFISSKHELDIELFRNMDALIGPQITQLASVIGELYAKQTQPLSASLDPSGFQYIFFNPLSLSLKTSFLDQPQDGTQLATASSNTKSEVTKSLPIPKQVVKLVCELREETCRGKGVGEVLAKSEEEWWVVGKRANQRELYLLLSPKHSSLTEVHEEVKRLIDTYFQHLFLLE